MLVLPLMLPDMSITNAMEFSDFRFRNLVKMSSPTVERMSLRNMLVASAARSAAILWRLQGDDCSMGHLHDSVQFYYYDHNAFRFSFHILIWKSQGGLDGKSSHSHKKAKPWRILVVVVKWDHRALSKQKLQGRMHGRKRHLKPPALVW